MIATAAEERDSYVLAYGCVAWTDEALDAIAARGPVVEVGAGCGQWARALRDGRGCDVVAARDTTLIFVSRLSAQ